jgi:hypothetical protein
VHVRHFSFIEIFTTGIGDLFRELKESVFDGLTAGLGAEAKPPSCDGEDIARADGYTIASDSKDTVYWCFGLEDSRRVLRVVNNRRYPLAMTHPGLSVAQQGGGGWRLERFSRLFSGDEAIVSPREQLTFAVSLNSGAAARIRTRFDGVGYSLYQLQVGVEAAIEVLTRFGAGSGVTVIDLMDKFMAVPRCASAIGGTAGDLISLCFDKDTLAEALGPRAYLVAPTMAAAELLSFLRSAFNAFGDQFNGRDTYRIVIRRAPAQVHPPPPAPTPPSAQPAPSEPQGYQVGDSFDLFCQVAWPTAPTRTTNSIEMTMQCPGIPAEFLLVYVSFGEPNLPITPSTGRVRVRGRIVNHARNELGFKLLVVIADSVEIP